MSIVAPTFPSRSFVGDLSVVANANESGTITANKLQILNTSATAINANGGATLGNGLQVSCPSITAFGVLCNVVNSVLNQTGIGALLAQVYADPNGTGLLTGNPLELCLVPTLNLTAFTPANNLSNKFSMRLSGWIAFPAAEAFTFSFTVNNGIRVHINNVKYIDAYSNTTNTTFNFNTPTVITNFWYPILIEFFSSTGTDTLIVQWTSSSTTKTVIPSNYLYYDGNSAPPSIMGTFTCNGTQFTTGNIGTSTGVSIGNVSLIPSTGSNYALTLPQNLPTQNNSVLWSSSTGVCTWSVPGRVYTYSSGSTGSLVLQNPNQIIDLTITATQGTGGKSTYYLTSDGTATGAVIFNGILGVFLSLATTSAVSSAYLVPYGASEPYSSDYKSIVIDTVRQNGATVLAGSASAVGTSCVIYLLIRGTSAVY